MVNERALYDSREAAPNSIMISDVIATALRLREIVDTETHGLLNMEFKRLEQVQDEKVRLLDKLEKQKKLIRQNREVLMPYGEEEKQELEEVSRVLEQSLMENAMQLIKAREVNRMVVQAIADAIASQIGKGKGYNKKGVEGAKAHAKDIVPPMQINEVI